MGLFSFGKKKKNEDQSNEDNEIMSDKIIFENLLTDEDQYITGLAEKMINGHPLILNFEPLDIDQANKVIAFLSGVIYAIHGEIANVQEKVFMFAASDVYDDGSMEEFLKDVIE
ncbi:MAG: cell division protein SepF [Tenericutes bacterium]|jgi:cell division inhibitor SepF|nr:cell division protein SepF [Mycoplasmatota bacterium]